MDTDADTIDRLARIETKLDALVETRTDTEGRLRRLERFVWVALGLGVTGVAPFVAHAATLAA